MENLINQLKEINESQEKEIIGISKDSRQYTLRKLSRRKDPINKNPSLIFSGQYVTGYCKVLTDKSLKDIEDDNFEGEWEWESQIEAKPKINSPFLVTGLGRWLQTSRVCSYYVHDDPDNYSEHPDKLILPKDFPTDAYESLPSDLKKGDIIICTMNSFYLCRPI